MQRRIAIVATAVLALIAVGIVLVLSGGGGGTASGAAADAAQRARVIAPGLTPDEAGQAALLALAGDRLQPGVAGEMAMLEVALKGSGVERVIETGANRVTATIRLEHLILTSGDDSVLRVWRPATGALVGEARSPHAFVTFGEAAGLPLAAAADSTGLITLVDLSDPHHPRLLPLAESAGRGKALAIGFSAGGKQVLVVRHDGEVERFATVGGRRLGSASILQGLTGASDPGSAALVIAQFAEEYLGPPRHLLLAFANGAVVSVGTGGGGARLLLAPGQTPGAITSVAQIPSGQIAVGTRGGLVSVEKRGETPIVETGPPVSGVAFNDEDELLIAETEGVTRRSEDWESHGPYGRTALGLSGGHGGVLALNPDGAITVLGPIESGLGLPHPSVYSPVVAFLPGGGLVLAEGWAPNHIERLVAVRPGHETVEGNEVPSPEIRAYEPAASWWPDPEESEEGEEESGLYVNDVVADREFVGAGGQDPNGEAAVMVWDAGSGRPVRHLPLSTGGLNPNEPSIVTTLALIPGKHLLAAYSAVQQLVAVWSTDSWKLLASIPVGQAGDLEVSPDESTLVAVGVNSDEETVGSGKVPSKLVFIDTGSMAIDHEVRSEEVDRAVFSPDGTQLSLLGLDGTLRFRSADGRVEDGPPIQLEGQPLELAWRPDGKLLAVSVDERGVVLVDPHSRQVSAPLPNETTEVFDLAWSGDGRFLADSAAAEDEETGVYDAEATEIWGLSAPRLQRRMCQLAGGPMDSADWHKLVDPELPARRLCRPQVALPSSPARIEKVVLGTMAFMPGGTGWGTEAPETIFNGGDPSGLVTHIHWRDWGQPTATGFGQTSIFKPRGGYYPRGAKIELHAERLGHCGLQRSYTKLRVKVPHRPGGPLGPWLSWSGSSTICAPPSLGGQ